MEDIEYDVLKEREHHWYQKWCASPAKSINRKIYWELYVELRHLPRKFTDAKRKLKCKPISNKPLNPTGPANAVPAA